VVTKFKGVSTSAMSWNSGGRPSKRDMVKNPPRQPSQLGKETWESSRPSKVAIEGKGQK
jgi:hypothetical protein